MWQKARGLAGRILSDTRLRALALALGTDDRRTDAAQEINLGLREAAASEEPSRDRHQELGIGGIVHAAGGHGLLPVAEESLDGLNACRLLVLEAGLPVVELSLMPFGGHERHVHLVGRIWTA